MTLLVAFHRSGYRTFKDFYLKYVCVLWRKEFPRLVSYNRFIEYLPSALAALCAYLGSRFAPSTGVNYLDSTALSVCHNRRIRSHKVFAGLAERGKTSVGWFFGFKLHLVVNHLGELVNCAVTAGNVDDRKPVPQLMERVFGKVFADRGYVSQELMERLRDQFDIFFCTKRKRNMPNVLMLLEDKMLLRKRGMIECVIDCLKNECQIEHTRHRSVTSFCTHLVAGLIAYSHRPNKPSIVKHTCCILQP
ncbi:transposase [Armatimonadota bacterium]|nr:transposase [Armatimonadota bacterium]